MGANIQDKDITVLDFDTTSKSLIPYTDHLRFIETPDLRTAEHLKNVFILTPASRLVETSDFVHVVKSNLRALLIHDEVASTTWLLHLLKKARIGQSRKIVVHTDPQVPFRILNAWQVGGQTELIADATVQGDNLLITSCAFELIVLPFNAISALEVIPQNKRQDFIIESDGSSINWPEFDIEIELEGIRIAIDPELKAQADQDRITHDTQFGNAITTLRKAVGLRQSDIKGLSERQVRRIESGESSATADAIEHLAHAHGMSPNDYMNKIAQLISNVEDKSNLLRKNRELKCA